MLGSGDRLTVEADEFDRSFLRLDPDTAVITSADPDHLDIYGTHGAMKEAFAQFIRQIRPGGYLVLKRGTDLRVDKPAITVYGYACDAPADFHAANVRLLDGGRYRYDIVVPDGVYRDCTLGVPGWVNVENSVAAVAAAWCAARARGRTARRGAAARRAGLVRGGEAPFRMLHQHAAPSLHGRLRPSSARAGGHARFRAGDVSPAAASRRSSSPTSTRGRAICATVSPRRCSLADEAVLLPIYPAREEPIPGVDSQMIARRLTVPWRIVEREALAETVAAMDTDVVISFGAGNIDAAARRSPKTEGEKLERLCLNTRSRSYCGSPWPPTSWGRPRRRAPYRRDLKVSGLRIDVVDSLGARTPGLVGPRARVAAAGRHPHGGRSRRAGSIWQASRPWWRATASWTR